MVTYYHSQTEVLVGDHIEFKVWIQFWRGWQPGRIYYVPGISPRHPELERDGMLWVSVHSSAGGQLGIWVEPASQQLRRTVRFVRRTDDRLTTTPPDYYFGDGDPPKARSLTRSARLYSTVSVPSSTPRRHGPSFPRRSDAFPLLQLSTSILVPAIFQAGWFRGAGSSA